MADIAEKSGHITGSLSCGDGPERIDDHRDIGARLPSAEAAAVPLSSDVDDLTRRDLLKRAAVLGAAAVLPLAVLEQAHGQASLSSVSGPLTAEEFTTLEAIVGRIIPSDENGPGALEAGAARYIARSLQGPFASATADYSSGLAAMNQYSQTSKGAAFAKLPPAQQDVVLSEIENGAITGFPNSPAFFNLVRTHTIEGMFSDPYYGGNAKFAGWDLIGYPGVRTIVTAEEQRMDAKPAPTHMSAYDHRMFSKKGI